MLFVQIVRDNHIIQIVRDNHITVQGGLNSCDTFSIVSVREAAEI